MSFIQRAWRELLYCALGSLAGLFGFLTVVVTMAPGLALSVTIVWTVVGLLLVTLSLRLAVRFGGLHRHLLARVLGHEVGPPPPFQQGTGVLNRLDRRLRYRAGWRAVWYALVKLPVAAVQAWAVVFTVMGLIDVSYPMIWLLFRHAPPGGRLSPIVAVTPVPFGDLTVATGAGTLPAALIGIACVLGGRWLAVGSNAVDQRLIRGLLGPSSMAERVTQLERTRALAVDDAAAALRRVERDLHDGAQMRLAALAMNLGMAQEKLGPAPAGTAQGKPVQGKPAQGKPAQGKPVHSELAHSELAHSETAQANTAQGEPVPAGTGPADVDALRDLLEAAQRNAADALADLRDIARGIHPPALDNGLAVALESLAAASAIPATLTVDLPGRPAPAIETITYFCAAELIANSTKHSYANQIKIEIFSERAELLALRISDDGVGGADQEKGSGLDGLAQRVSTVDGRIEVSSPAGGPTVVTVELPLRAQQGAGAEGNADASSNRRGRRAAARRADPAAGGPRAHRVRRGRRRGRADRGGDGTQA
jgi:signal transduction histidine kinase